MTKKANLKGTEHDHTIQTSYDQVYYQQNRDRILEQRRENRKTYMRNYRLLMKVKSKLKKNKKSKT